MSNDTHSHGRRRRSSRYRLHDWYAQPLGRRLAQAEHQELGAILPNLFGYHLLQVGDARGDLLAASRILHRAVMAVATDGRRPSGQLAGEPEYLPLRSETVDALILYHVLEFSGDPHQILRETERTLVPEGHAVILGFNPWGFWGLRRLLGRRRPATPWEGKFIGLARLKDWLRLLGFDIVHARQLFFRPPVQSEGVVDRLEFLERWGTRWWPFFGGVYVVVGRKKVETLTPIKPRWRPRRSVVSGIAGPAS